MKPEENAVLKSFEAEIIDKEQFDKKVEYVDRGLAAKNTGHIAHIWDKVLQLWGYVRSDEVPWTAKILPLAGLVYLVSPMDLVPDFIPVAGLMDDAAVILYIAATVVTGIQTLRATSDKAIDTVIIKTVELSDEQLKQLDIRWKQSFIITLFIDIVLITVVAVCILVHYFAYGALVIANIAKVLWTLYRGVLCYRALYPHREYIRRFAFPFFQILWRKLSVKIAVEETVRQVFRYIYTQKVPEYAQTLHTVGSYIGVVPGTQEIEDKTVARFEPRLRRYLNHLILVNIFCLCIFYGLLLVLIKLWLAGHCG